MLHTAIELKTHRLTDWVHQHRHSTAANEAVIPTVIIVELKRHQFGRLLLAGQFEGPSLHFRFNTPSAKGADLRAVPERRASLLLPSEEWSHGFRREPCKRPVVLIRRL